MLFGKISGKMYIDPSSFSLWSIGEGGGGRLTFIYSCSLKLISFEMVNIDFLWPVHTSI